MRQTGIVRELDKLGRIVIPAEFRNNINLVSGDKLSIRIENESIVLTKFTPSCVFCNGEYGLTEINGRYVCNSCIEMLKLL